MADVVITDAKGQAADAETTDLLLPVAGAWTAHLVLQDAETVPEGLVTLSVLGTDLQGYVLRSGETEGLVRVLVAGGAGGLWKQVSAKHYDYAMAVSLPLQEILAAAGERLSAESTAAVLATTLPNWPRRAGEAGHLLDELARQVGALWSCEPDGSIWFGRDTWEPVDGDWPEDGEAGYELLSQDPAADVLELRPATLGLWPGDQLRGRRVGTVHYTVTSEEARARAWLLRDEALPGEDPLRVGLEALIHEVMAHVDYHVSYPGRVVTQRANGTLDVILDSNKIPPLTSVPVRVPVPGAKLVVPSGSRVLVSFGQGDPTLYQAELYESGEATRGAARVQDSVGYLLITIANAGLAGVPVVTTMGWSPTLPPPPVIPAPPVGPAPGVYAVALSITSGSPHLLLPG